MKADSKLGRLTLGFALCVASPAVGQGQGAVGIERFDRSGDARLQRGEVPMWLISEFDDVDLDGDGSLDASELAAFESRRQHQRDGRGADSPSGEGGPPATLEELIERRDRNQDGKLSRDEIPEPMQAAFERIDPNGDGVLDRAEARELDARRARQERSRTVPARRTVARTVELMDTNGDGLLQKKEAPLAVQAAFEELDTNGDGAIDLNEAAAADAATVRSTNR
jgi:Ca2+-binding EF-hand superfamily protein